METSEKKSIIIIVLLFITILFGTCQFLNRNKIVQKASPADSKIAEQWKQEKEQLIEQYNQKIGRLQQVKDSLWFLVVVQKKSLKLSRVVSAGISSRLDQTITRHDTTAIIRDSIRPLVDSLTIAIAKQDTACDQTVSTLENIVVNRDSTISFQKQSEQALKDLNKEQVLKNQDLEQQINDANKSELKTIRQKKWITGALVFVSGLATAFILTQHSR